MSLGKFVLHQVDIVGDEPGFLLKQCTVRDLPHHLPGEYLRDDCTLYASVCDVVDDSMAQALGVRDGDLICDEEDGICQLSDLRTARNLVSQSRYTLLLLREQTKRDGVKVKAPRLGTRQKVPFQRRTKGTRLAETPERKAKWDAMYAKLEGFKRKHGHCDVWHKFQDKALVVWVQNQRGARRRNSMPLRRIEALDRIGFLWGAPGRTTPDLLRDDSEEEEGDGRQEERVGRVTRSSPKKASSSLEFGGTLDSSAKDYIGSGDDLSEEEKVTALAMLDLARANLVSDPTPPKVTETDDPDTSLMDSSERPFHRQQWDTMFRKLVVYKQSHGHCNVPRRHACKALGEWVKNQRRSFAENSLLPRRLAALQSIGFVWETQNKGHGGKRKKGKKDRRKGGHKRPAASKDTNGSLGGDCSMEAPPPKRFRAEYDYSFAKKDEHRATSSKARNVGSFITSIKALIPTSLTRNPSSDLF